MIGTTRSRVSFFMNKFRKKGFIDYNGKIEVHRSLLDAVLREKPQIDEDDVAARRGAARSSGSPVLVAVREMRKKRRQPSALRKMTAGMTGLPHAR